MYVHVASKFSPERFLKNTASQWGMSPNPSLMSHSAQAQVSHEYGTHSGIVGVQDQAIPQPKEGLL